ncbi:MAG: ATP-binding protein [Anaerolineales bacterium]
MATTTELLTENQLRNRVKKLQRVLQINRDLSATLDLQDLLHSIVRAAAELTDSEQGAIAQYDPPENCLKFITAPWMSAEIMEKTRVPLEGSIMGQAFRTLWPVISEDVKANQEHYRGVDEAVKFTTRSLLAVPLAVKGEATGVLSAVNKRDGPFNKEDIFLMESLAAQAAIAVENAQLIRETRDAYHALAQLDKMRNNFVAITSHELRIPLGLILGHASYMKETLSGESRDQVLVIEKAAHRLKQIVEDLSKIDMIEEGRSTLRIEEYDLLAQMHSLLASHQEEAEKHGISLTGRLPTGPMMIQAEREKVHLAVSHLLRNAVGFTNEGGKVELTFREVGYDIAITVADTGIGIPQKDITRIFERFYQVEDHMTRKHGGLGLGLTVAKLLVEMHQGNISVESVEGQGSRFTIRLPKYARTSAIVTETARA